MSLRKPFILAGTALIGLSVVSSAQQGTSGKVFARYNKPLETAELDLSTGVLTRGPQVGNKAVVTTSTFSNVDLGGFVGVDTGSCACEWIDAGIKTGNASNFMTSWFFAYCSSSLDTNSGGIGGAAEWFFIEGYTKGGSGGAPNGTEVGRFCLTGLPANTASSSFFGGFRCFFINVTFGQFPLCFSDGAIGYGWKFKDLGTDGVLAATFPFLSCVQSCSGPGPDGLGMTDCIDQYCPPGSLLSTFSFGTTTAGGYFTSISFDVREATPTAHVTQDFNPGCPTPNSNRLTDLSFGSGAIGTPALARTWHVDLNCVGSTPAAFLIRITVFGVNAGVNLPQGCFYLNGKVQDISGAHGGSIVSIRLPLPKDLGFACLPFQVQGFCGGTPAGASTQLSNALVSTVNVPIR